MTNLDKAIEEIQAIEDEMIAARQAEDRHEELVSALKGATILSVRHVRGEIFEMLVEGFTVVRFEYKDVHRGGWK